MKEKLKILQESGIILNIDDEKLKKFFKEDINLITIDANDNNTTQNHNTLSKGNVHYLDSYRNLKESKKSLNIIKKIQEMDSNKQIVVIIKNFMQLSYNYKEELQQLIDEKYFILKDGKQITNEQIHVYLIEEDETSEILVEYSLGMLFSNLGIENGYRKFTNVLVY